MQPYYSRQKLQVLNFDGILPSVQAGKADFAMSGFTITKERAESVLFSEPYYKGGTVMAVRKSGQGATGGSIIDSITESFSKTFLREDRWKLFFEGVVTTLLITILSIILGTTLGFVVFVLCRSGELAFEELVVPIVRRLANPEVQAIIEYLESTETALLTLRYNGPAFDIRTNEDKLVTDLLSGLASQVDYTWDEGNDLPNKFELTITHT